jgi:hypothetical protein
MSNIKVNVRSEDVIRGKFSGTIAALAGLKDTAHAVGNDTSFSASYLMNKSAEIIAVFDKEMAGLVRDTTLQDENPGNENESA